MSNRSTKRKKTERLKADQSLLFGAVNYKILLIAMALLGLGFGGMYIENAFKGWYSLYVAPILVVAGFILVAVGIMKNADERDSLTETETP
jgi:hypothetical protein